jgi:hypothetical protein
MRKAIIVCAVGALLLGTLLVIPSALGKGDSAKRAEVWWYEAGSTSLHKAIFQTTGSGIVHEWRYEPEHLTMVFKPANKFREPDEGDYTDWTYDWWLYTPVDSPSHKTLDGFFTRDAHYWCEITMQD